MSVVYLVTAVIVMLVMTMVLVIDRAAFLQLQPGAAGLGFLFLQSSGGS
jgi:hypothetical protein